MLRLVFFFFFSLPSSPQQDNLLRMGSTAPILGTRYWKTAQAARLSMLSLFAFQQSMDVILECFWDLNLNGFPKTIGGEEFLIVPYLSNFSADLMEAWDAACRPKNGSLCHLKLCMTKDDYNRSDVRNSV